MGNESRHVLSVQIADLQWCTTYQRQILKANINSCLDTFYLMKFQNDNLGKERYKIKSWKCENNKYESFINALYISRKKICKWFVKATAKVNQLFWSILGIISKRKLEWTYEINRTSILRVLIFALSNKCIWCIYSLRKPRE